MLKRSPMKRRRKVQIERVIVMPGGREVCNDDEYARRRGVMIVRQLGRCAICHKPGHALEFDHEAGRGMGGSRRDDRIWKLLEDGVEVSVETERTITIQRNAALCSECNTIKGSRRYEWRDGIYQPIEKEVV